MKGHPTVYSDSLAVVITAEKHTWNRDLTVNLCFYAKMFPQNDINKPHTANDAEYKYLFVVLLLSLETCITKR